MKNYLFLLGFIFIIAGVGMLIYSSSLELHTNTREYEDKLFALERFDNAGFDKLKYQYLSNKNGWEDYGVTFSLLGFLLIFFSWFGIRSLKSPSHGIFLLAIGILASLGSISGFAWSIVRGVERGEEPPWDNFVHAMMGLPILFCFILFWMVVNYLGSLGDFLPRQLLRSFKLRDFLSYYGILTLFSALLTLFAMFFGVYWIAFPGVLWVYFYASILLGRKMYERTKSNGKEAKVDKTIMVDFRTD